MDGYSKLSQHSKTHHTSVVWGFQKGGKKIGACIKEKIPIPANKLSAVGEKLENDLWGKNTSIHIKKIISLLKKRNRSDLKVV